MKTTAKTQPVFNVQPLISAVCELIEAFELGTYFVYDKAPLNQNLQKAFMTAKSQIKQVLDGDDRYDAFIPTSIHKLNQGHLDGEDFSSHVWTLYHVWSALIELEAVPRDLFCSPLTLMGMCMLKPHEKLDIADTLSTATRTHLFVCSGCDHSVEVNKFIHTPFEITMSELQTSAPALVPLLKARLFRHNEEVFSAVLPLFRYLKQYDV